MGTTITEAPPSGLVSASPVGASITSPYQLFDVLPEHVEEALRASIERFGVIVPVVRDQHGSIIDGHHRARIAADLGVEYPEDTVTVSGEDEAREIARHLNTRRRHLSGEQLREHIVMLAQRVTPAGIGELSQGEIARVIGVSQQYVSTVLKDPELTTDCELPDLRRGADGKVRPAHRETAPAPVEPAPPAALFSDADEWAEPDAEPAHLLDGAEMETVAPTVFARPVPPPAPADPVREARREAVGGFLSGPDAKTEHFELRGNFLAAQSSAAKITEFDVEAVAFALDTDASWDQVHRLREQLNEWFDRLEAARPRGLRIIGGNK